ncbi:MAG: hypothetical protein ACFB10_15185 [Salibacteraceae bacterium]
MLRSLKQWFLWLTIFSIAMAFLETAVVVYLRKLFYPDGFGFPLVPISQDLTVVEFWREVATMIMLLGAGVMAGKTAARRFAGFLFCFAIWDIFYYVFLKVLLDWPQAWGTWDVLFLVPFPWVGPFETPLLITCIMIGLSASMAWYDHRGIKAGLRWQEWTALITGSLVVIFSWVLDYFRFIETQFPNEVPWTLSLDRALFEGAETYVPQTFDWWIFSLGFVVICAAWGIYLYRMRGKAQVQELSPVLR